VSGTAQNGVDFTNIADVNGIGTVTIPSESDGALITVEPLWDTLVEFDEPLTITLLRGSGYVIDPDSASATIMVKDNFPTNIFTVVTNLDGPVGLDYSPTTNALIASINFFDSGRPFNFMRIGTNGGGAVVTHQWSGISNLTDEIKLAIVPSTASGFTQGDMYFGNGTNGQIGKLSADGSAATITWAVLTTNVETTESLLRGGLYFDQSGSFGGDLIAVTGGNLDQGGGVWRINSASNALQAAHITGLHPHLEGVVTLTNDIGKWGPWAGKIITGAESETPPLIYAVDTNGVVSSFDLGIGPEDFDIIPPNQDLYCTDEQHQEIHKLPRILLTNYWGDLLITQSGDGQAGAVPKLFIVKWDATNHVFNVRSITHDGEFEHVTFAPISLPSH
jgi:hypothetical protein